MAIGRHFDNVLQPYDKKEEIPQYLDLVDHTLALSKVQYQNALKNHEADLNRLVRQLEGDKKFLIIVLQGRDAAGKSGATERIIQAIDYDPRLFMWVPIGPPTEDERSHPYLWRFLTGERMPKFGQIRVFDRSWAERLLVERVMSLAKPKDIERSYAEIRAFEWLLESQGAILVKLWLDITKAEQLKRFKKRQAEKPWKVSEADTESRKNWNAYTDAANEMFHRTGTDFAPWYLVSSEDKSYSRVAVMQVINEALEEALR